METTIAKKNVELRLTSYRVQTSTLASISLAPCIGVIADFECLNKRCWIFASPEGAPGQSGWYHMPKDGKPVKISEKDARFLPDDERLYISSDAAAAICTGKPVVFGTVPYLHGRRLVLYDHKRVEWAYAAVIEAESDNTHAKQMLRHA